MSNPAHNLPTTPGNGVYPFAAIAGQGRMKLALVLAGIDPGLGGVLLRGEKGTAKSTAARGLARLLPRQDVVKGCPVGCDPQGPWCDACLAAPAPLPRRTRPTPFVDLPLGATEDRVAGALDLSQAIKHGRLAWSPGVLARAHRGVLYVDEINLLPPFIAHLILDAAAGGWARVEREGIGFSHPASFTLIASMNPEEGPISPQLTDRFGLCVEVVAEPDPARRKEVLRRRLAWEADPAAFAKCWSAEQSRLAERLATARAALPTVAVDEAVRARAADLAGLANAAGQRGELALVRAVRALAAWNGEAAVRAEHLDQVADLALIHRARSAPAEAQGPQGRVLPLPPGLEAQPEEVRVTQVVDADEAREQGYREGDERALHILAPGAVKPVTTRLPARETGSLKQAGRRAAREVAGGRGRYIRASAQRLGRGLAFDATFRAAAPHQKARRVAGGPALVVREPDVREKVRAAKRGRLLLFVVDSSGSMNAAARMRETKAAVLGLLTEAYQKRDRVGLVAFGGASARELLPPTASVEVARRLLADLPTGGKTPLAAGMALAADILRRELAQDPKLTPLVVLMTDGRPNVPLRASTGERYDSALAGNKGGGWGDGWGDGGYADREVLNMARRMAADPRPHFVVVDTDVGHHHEINLCRPLADYLGAPCVPLRVVTMDQVLDLVRANWV